MSFLDYIPPEQTCFVPIDVQEMFCNPRYWSFLSFFQPWRATSRTDECARKIGRIAPQFNALSIDVAWVYYASEYNLKKPFRMAGKLYGVEPSSQDAIIPKIDTSAFRDDAIIPKIDTSAFRDDAMTPFEQWLEDNNKTHMIVCGFYLTACVYATVIDAAIRGYKVTVLADASTDGRIADGYEEAHRTSLARFADNIYSSSNKFGRSIEVSTSDFVLGQLRQKRLWRSVVPS